MIEIKMPRIGANDNSVMIGEWNVSNSDRVSKKQLIAGLESTKETSDLYSKADGYITIIVEAGNEVEVGTVIATIDEDVKGSEKASDSPKKIVKSDAKTNITKKALALAQKHNIDLSVFASDKMIREQDVMKLITPESKAEHTMTNHVAIYGTGGFAREIIAIIRQTHAYEIECIIGGIGDLSDTDSIMGIPIVSNTNLDGLLEKGCNKIINAVAVTPGSFSRKDIFAALKKKGFEFPNIINQRAYVGEDVRMEEGNIIFAGAMIGQEAYIGNDCVINVNTSVSHSCIVGDHCHIATGAILGGNVEVGSNVLIGQGCTIYSGVKIGSNVVIQNGCHIYKDVPDGSIIKLPR